MKIQELNKILKEFKHLNSCDPESDHSIADTLLTDCLFIISKNTEYEQIIQKIIKAYENVDKWYE